MQYFLRSTISLSLLTAFLFGGLLQAQEQEIRIKIRKQDGDKVIEIDETILGDENFDIEAWLEEMGLDEFESDFQNIDVDVEIEADGANGEKTITIDNTDGEKRIMMIQSDDPAELEELMKKHGGDDETIIIIGGDEDNMLNKEEMHEQMMKHIQIIKKDLGDGTFEIVEDYFDEVDSDKGTLGVMMQVDAENQRPIITEILPGSAAEKAGFHIGDEIVGIGDVRVSTYEGVVEALAEYKKDDVVKIWYHRTIAGDLLEMVKTVTLQGPQRRMQFYGASPNADEKRQWVESTRGTRSGSCCPPSKVAEGSKDDTRGYLGVQIVDSSNGVVVDGIAPGSAASKSNISDGMVITSLDRQTIINTDQLIALLKDKKPGDKVKVAYKDEAGKTWKEKLRLQSRPSAFAQTKGSCAPADRANCCPGQAGMICTPEKIAAFCDAMGCTPEQKEQCMQMAGKACTPDQMAACMEMMGKTCTPEEIAACCPELAGKCLTKKDFKGPARKYMEVKTDQNGQTTKIVIIEKDKSNNSDSAKIKVIISEVEDTETKVLEESENAPKANLKSLELEELSFFPNPSDGNVQLSFRGEENDYNVRITDLSGQEIYRGKTGRVSEFQTKIDISDNPDGVYLLQIYSDSQILNRKIIVK